MTALDEFEIQSTLTSLLDAFTRTAIENAAGRQAVLVNQDATLGDLSRDFERQAPLLGVPFSRRGLETSGLRNVGIDRQLSDFQRNFTRQQQGFTQQLDAFDVNDLQNQATFQQNVANTEQFAAARRQELATQIRGL